MISRMTSVSRPPTFLQFMKRSPPGPIIRMLAGCDTGVMKPADAVMDTAIRAVTQNTTAITKIDKTGRISGASAPASLL